MHCLSETQGYFSVFGEYQEGKTGTIPKALLVAFSSYCGKNDLSAEEQEKIFDAGKSPSPHGGV